MLLAVVMINIFHHQFRKRSLVSSVCIVSDYKLDDQGVQGSISGRCKVFFSSLCVQTSFEAHPASYPMGTGGHFPGVKVRPERDADHSSTSSAKVKNAYIFSPLAACLAVMG
jgi:hypothetical protein